MDFDWNHYPPEAVPEQRRIEECFEDPFSLKIIPDGPRFVGSGRFFCLGRDLAGDHWLVVYSTNGRQILVRTARALTRVERAFYEAKIREDL